MSAAFLSEQKRGGQPVAMTACPPFFARCKLICYADRPNPLRLLLIR